MARAVKAHGYPVVLNFVTHRHNIDHIERIIAPCRSCDDKAKDFGGCRCQACMLTGDATNVDPVCSKSVHHGIILATREQAEQSPGALDSLVMRNEKASQLICKA